MDFSDFKQYFSRFSVCKYCDTCEFNGIPIDPYVNGYNLIEVEVFKKGHVTFSVSQTDERCLPRNIDHTYASCRMILIDASSEIMTLGNASRVAQYIKSGKPCSYGVQTL